jgi:hypothetical protein
MRRVLYAGVMAVLLAAGAGVGHGSSHREAPGITKMPKVDGTDFYMFRSYEENRAGYVTLLANYYPLQDPYGGPNFFMLDEDAVYEIHIDNNGDAREDLTFQFQFQRLQKNIAVAVGDRMVAVPLVNVGGIGPGASDTANANVEESYMVRLVRGPRRTGQVAVITNAADGSAMFRKPVDRIGDKSIRDNDPGVYSRYADDHIYGIDIPGCDSAGRVFVGQRREGFVVNLGEVFDLINTNPLGAPNAETNDLADKSITTIALEVPIGCVVSGDPVIGAWTTASSAKKSLRGTTAKRRIPPGQLTQVSRLGHPLVNEVVIGLKDKDTFNASEPAGDAQFLEYVTHPTLPVLIQALFGVAPPAAPRGDLVQVFLTGIPGLNQPANVTPGEMLRLNTATAPVAAPSQHPLGVIGGDTAGFPNGRRPGDDVVDVALRVVEGLLVSPNPAAFPALTDGAFVNATVAYDPGTGATTGNAGLRLFRDTFPYLAAPLAPSPK